MNLADERPVFIDLETRSAADLKVVGGWNYAIDPSTSLLTVSWSSEKDEYHVWLPTVDGRTIPPAMIQLHLEGVRVHTTREAPGELRAVRDRPWYAHNAWTFDQLVWEQLQPGMSPVRWGDTYPLALAAGLPGGLNAIGVRLWGEGKYEEGNRIAKQATRVKPGESSDPRDVPMAQLIQVARYNVQDVRLLAWLWEELVRTLKMPQSEWDVLEAHRVINDRGCRVDVPMIGALSRLSADCRHHAIERIDKLTDGYFKSVDDLRKRTKVLAWLDEIGVEAPKVGEKASLRKELVQRFIEKNADEEPLWTGEEHEESDPDDATEVRTAGLPLAMQVLELRMTALRITDGKLAAAMQSIDSYERARFLFAYWAAHTGRWAGRRIQVQNLPRPKEGVDVWKLLSGVPEGREFSFSYDGVARTLPLNDPLYRFLSVEDAVSALIRSLFLPDVGGILAAADLANIEARVLAWLAGEKWLMEAFWKGTDPYMAMAERIFGPRDKWPRFPDPKKPGEFLPLKKHPYRQVGKVIELGSGYQLGFLKMAVYAAANGIDLDAVGTSAKECVLAYRKSHPAIAGEEAGEYKGVPYFRGGFWGHLNMAAFEAAGGGVASVGPVTFYRESGHLICELPSGRRLVYRNVQVKTVPHRGIDGKMVDAVVYNSARYGPTPLYGGKIAENVVQAVSRDMLAAAMVRCEREGIRIVLHVHDELVASLRSRDQFPRFMELMTTPPDWAPNFPLDAEGGLAPRYAKSAPPEEWGYGKEVVYRNGGLYK